jgi:ABC-2 type transport system permease protein
MNKTLMVLRYEFLGTIRRTSFLLFALGIPVLAVIVFAAIAILGSRGGSSSQSADASPTANLSTEGYVDYSGLIKQIPENVPENVLLSFPGENSAREAFSRGEISSYYVIPQNFIQSGEIIYVNPDYSPVNSSGQTWVMRQTLVFNLLNSNQQLNQVFWQPIKTIEKPVGGSASGQSGNTSSAFGFAYPMMMMFYILILTSSSLLLNNVGNEKKNRVVEVMLVSVTPQQMLTGKFLALGLVGLLQTSLWLGTFYGLLKVFGTNLNFLSQIQFTPYILFWGILFFVLGYAVYASLMGAMGALAENPKEASQSIILVIAPLIVPMMLFVVLIEQPLGTLATVLGIFPLTAPMAMMTRLAAAQIPLWQPVLAAALLALTAILVMRGAANLFRAQFLLSGQKFSARRYFNVLLGRASQKS